MNRFSGIWHRDGGQVAGVVLPCEAIDLPEGSLITLSIRPEKILLQPPSQNAADISVDEAYAGYERLLGSSRPSKTPA